MQSSQLLASPVQSLVRRGIGLMNEAVPQFLLAKNDSVDLIDKGVDGWVYKCVRNGAVTAVKNLFGCSRSARVRTSYHLKPVVFGDWYSAKISKLLK